MFEAELHGKYSPSDERKEDILTSNVFSFFKYARREIFLFNLLSDLNLKINPKDLNEADFIFWPSFEDGTEPDLIIIVGDYYLLFEAKFYSGFSGESGSRQHQVEREFKAGELDAKNNNKKFIMVAITAHYTKHQFLFENPELERYEIIWLNWHRIALLINNILMNSKHLDCESICFAEDLYSLLEKKNLRNFGGKDILLSKSIIDILPRFIFFNSLTAQFRGDFLGFVPVFQDLNKIPPMEKNIFLSKNLSFFSFGSHYSIEIAPYRIFMEV